MDNSNLNMKYILILILFFSIQCVMSNQTQSSGVSSETVLGQEARTLRAVDTWIAADKLLKAMSAKAVKTILSHAVRSSGSLNLTSKCMGGLLKFLTGIKKTNLWAFQMLDSFGKINSGLLRGSVTAFGDYDLCLNTEVPGSFSGQYCSVDVLPPLPERTPFVPYDVPIPEFADIGSRDSVSTDILNNLRGLYWLKIRTGICVPSSCSQGEVQIISLSVVNATGLDLKVRVSSCETKHQKVLFGKSEMAVIFILSLLLFVAAIATLFDVILKMKSGREHYTNKLSIISRCLLCFSLYTNAKKLLKKDKSTESIKIFHGMKVITVIWVMLTHVYLFLNFQLASNLKQARAVTSHHSFIPVTHGHPIVQTFFFISAVLVAYGVMKMKEKNINVFLFIIRRFWRLTPPFMFVIACIHVVPYLGSGPAWKETVIDGLTNKCRTNWWTNLLYFNNFLDYRDMCMGWSWYIPVDFQLYLFSLLILIPLKRNPRLGLKLNAGFLAAATLLTAGFHVYYRVPPLFVPVFDHPDDISYIMERIYLRPHVHFPSFAVGIFVGYFLAARKKTFEIPLVWNVIGWITSSTLFLAMMYGVHDWLQGDLPSVLVSTVYACTEKLVFSLTVAWVTIVCMTHHGGIVNTILSWKGFVPLGRLTYMTYLIHPVIYYMYVGSTRELIRFEHRTIVFIFLALVLLSFMCAIPLSLLFEAPFMALEKLVLTSRNVSKRDETPENGNAPKIIETVTISKL